MDAPVWETIVRLGAALVATWAAGVLVYVLVRFRRGAGYPLLLFLGVILVVTAAWRWYIVWTGLQHDVDGSYAHEVEPWIRAIGTTLWMSLAFATGLVGLFYIKHGARLVDRREGD